VIGAGDELAAAPKTRGDRNATKRALPGSIARMVPLGDG
jgi:hypothetical protein